MVPATTHECCSVLAASRDTLACAGCACREAIAAAVGDRRFKFSLLVHSDEDAHLIDWNSNSSVLQVGQAQAGRV